MSIKVLAPQILWHGGQNEKGKPDRVYSIDMHPTNVLVTAGIDDSCPALGCVRLWNIDQLIVEESGTSNLPSFDTIEFDGKNNFLVEFNDHAKDVLAARFSPCGTKLATASQGRIIVYVVKTPEHWRKVTASNEVEKIWLSPALDDIHDISWSPDSSHIVAGSVDNRAEVVCLETRRSLFSLSGHRQGIHGVAWDPLDKFVCTESADRSLKLHAVTRVPSTSHVKLCGSGHQLAKMLHGEGRNLFADGTVESFFRRPAFSPDGAVLVAPTGLTRPPQHCHSRRHRHQHQHQHQHYYNDDDSCATHPAILHSYFLPIRLVVSAGLSHGIGRAFSCHPLLTSALQTRWVVE